MTEVEPIEEEAQGVLGDPEPVEEAGEVQAEAEVEQEQEAAPVVVEEEAPEPEAPPVKEKMAMADVRQAPDIPDFNDIYQVGAQAVINSLSRHKEAKDAVVACSERVAMAEASVAAAKLEHAEAEKREAEAKAATLDAVQAQKTLLENYLAG